MEHIIEVRHISMKVGADFESFTKRLEGSLGRFSDALYRDIETDPEAVRKRLEAAAGEEGMMLFTIRDHGKALNLQGAPKKARQYVIGNPLIAVRMTQHDIRAGLYAPLRIFVYEAEDHSTRVEYDQPSSLFGQFKDHEVTAIARSLDIKLTNLIEKAMLAAREPAPFQR